MENELLKELRSIRELLQQQQVPKLLYSRDEVAQMLGLSLREIDNLTAKGELPSRKQGSRRLYPRDAVLAWAQVK